MGLLEVFVSLNHLSHSLDDFFSSELSHPQKTFSKKTDKLFVLTSHAEILQVGTSSMVTHCQ